MEVTFQELKVYRVHTYLHTRRLSCGRQRPISAVLQLSYVGIRSVHMH